MDPRDEKNDAVDEIDLKDAVREDTADADSALNSRITRKLDFHILPCESTECHVAKSTF